MENKISKKKKQPNNKAYKNKMYTTFILRDSNQIKPKGISNVITICINLKRKTTTEKYIFI